MSYNTVEAALLTTIQLMSEYSDTNSSRGDYRVLGQGVTFALILMPGAIRDRSVFASPRRVSTTWEIILDMYVHFTGEMDTTINSIKSERQSLMDHLDGYPTLSGQSGVVEAFIVGGREPEMWQGEGADWWRQQLIYAVVEHTTITILE